MKESSTSQTNEGMQAILKEQAMLTERHRLCPAAIVELRIWRVPQPVQGSSHDLKYALAYVVDGVCVLRYDNEAGKGDHRHLGSSETDYAFKTPAALLADFWKDVDQWRPE